jgi:single-strand DNA-binding protein
MQFDLTFEGNVADAPELRFTPSGKALCKFRVGHNTRRRTTAGEWVNGPTIWFTVTAWQELAERIAESVRKGDTVTVNARNDLSVFAYTNQSTQKASAEVQVTAANVAISLRFAEAQSRRQPKPVAADEPWQDEMTADRESEPVG